MTHRVHLLGTFNPAQSAANVVQVTRTELRIVYRRFRFWLVALLLSGTAFSAYVLSCFVYVNIAPFNVSFVGGTPPYLLGNLDPAYFVFFQAGLLLLVFDFQHQIRRHRLEEIIESQPIRNLEFQLGRILCYSGLVWTVIFVNVLLMQCLGLLSQLFNFDIADTIQLHSMFNLLVVDAPVALLFWTSLFLVLTNLLRSRLLILVTSIAVMLAYYLWVLNTPFSFVDLLSHSSNQTLFISDILPALPSTTTWIMRIGTLLLAVALLALGACLYQRTDSTPIVWTNVLPLTSLGVGVLILTTGVLYELNKSNEFKSWKEAHLTYEWNTKLDVQAIQGEVAINPRRHMHIDLNVDFILSSQTPVRSLVFTLNPGYQISTINVNETPCEFEFNNGILQVSVPFVVEPETAYLLRIEATGKPNPRFAYLNTPYEYLNDVNFPIQALHSFGTDGSIYNSKFVALMPGVYWYPVPGPVPRVADDDSLRSDFFDVELRVQLDAPPSWKVVGPGTSILNSEEHSQYLIKPNIPIASIGLFASEYVEISHDFENAKLALYLHSRHAQNFAAIEQYNSSLLEKIDTYLKNLGELEFPVPYTTLAFVEVPNKLRTIGGGWRMGRLNSLPGVILLKERGFPTLNIERIVREVEEEYADRENIFNWMWGALLYADENALCNDRLTYGVRDQIWGHLVSVNGKHQRALSLIFPAMVGSLSQRTTDGVFSVYSTAQATRLTGLNLPSALGIGRDRDRGRGIFFANETLRYSESNYEARPAIWDLMERSALPSLNFDPESYQQNFEVLLLKSQKIANAFSSYFNFIGDGQKFERWLVTLRRDFTGQQFTYNEAIEIGHDLEIDITVFLNDWLTEDTLAGFEASHGTTTRIASNENGIPRYLFSFEIANTQPTSGYVKTSIPFMPGRVFELPGNTSKRVTFTWEPITTNIQTLSFSVITGLSLNRGPIGYSVPIQNVTVDESIAPDERIENIIFKPQQNGIIVDDLDAGFVVHQPKPFYSNFRFAPRDWIVRNHAFDTFDGTLFDLGSSSSIPRVFWIRRTEPNAYGKYRRTTAISSVGSSKKLYPARFIAEIPDAGRWSLDFHLHRRQLRQYLKFENFILEVENNSNRWTEEFYPDRLGTGWKTIGEFDLVAGKTGVVIVGTTKPSVVYADAIRWRKSDDID